MSAPPAAVRVPAAPRAFLCTHHACRLSRRALRAPPAGNPPRRRDVLRESARQEFEAARFEADPEIVSGRGAGRGGTHLPARLPRRALLRLLRLQKRRLSLKPSAKSRIARSNQC